MKFYKYNGRCNLCGENIRCVREAKGLTQEQLAARLQVAGLSLTQKAISRIETGERVVADYELVQLAAALDTEIKNLLSAPQH